MKKYKNLFKVVILLIAGLAITSSAQAILTLNFQENVAIARIQYYWKGEASNALQAGRIINNNPNAILNLADPNTQAKAGAQPPANQYVFGASADQPNSSTILVRVWDGGNTKYTDLKSFGNPALAPANEAFGAIAYKYVKDLPGDAEIVSVDEITSQPLPVLPNNKVTTLKVVVKQKARVDGLAVETAACKWTVTYKGANNNVVVKDVSGQTGTSLVLSTPAFVFNPGDQYVIKCQFQDLWGNFGKEVSYTHDVTSSDKQTQISLIFRKPNNKTGVNTFIIPFNINKPIVDGNDAPIANFANIGQLITSINNQANAQQLGNKVVTSFGWYDEILQQHVGFKAIPDGNMANAIPTGKDNDGNSLTKQQILDWPIIPNRPYQVTVNVNQVLFNIKGIK